MLPRGIEEITHMPLTYFSHLLPLHLFFCTSLTLSLNNSLLPSTLSIPLFPVMPLPSACPFPFSPSLPPSLLLCVFSLMSRPTAGCHGVDGGKKMGGGRKWEEEGVLTGVCVCMSARERRGGKTDKRSRSDRHHESVSRVNCSFPGCKHTRQSAHRCSQ